MSPSAVQELRLCHAASIVEAETLEWGARAPKAEQLQKSLWRHRAEILQMIQERDAVDVLVDQLLAGLKPFGRVASILTPGQNPVLFSISTAGGRSFVQLRPADFRRAAELAGMPS